MGFSFGIVGVNVMTVAWFACSHLVHLRVSPCLGVGLDSISAEAVLTTTLFNSITTVHWYKVIIYLNSLFFLDLKCFRAKIKTTKNV